MQETFGINSSTLSGLNVDDFVFSKSVFTVPSNTLATTKAFEAIRKVVQNAEATGGRTQWSFLGRDVCVAAWKRLHGLGHMESLVSFPLLFFSVVIASLA